MFRREITPPAGTVLLEPGTTLEGKYIVRRLIGAGGSAVVYEVEHIAIGKRAAIKVVCSDADPDRVLERFLREARTCGSLRHKNIGEVYDVGDLGDGTPYLVMELLEGESLEERMQSGRLPLPAIVEVARQALAGLEAVHRADCLHRDVKPHNIVLHREEDGEIVAKLVDFGISKPIGRAAHRQITEEGLIIGTPHYMSPEQARGLDLDARTDVYSLGVMLYELITGVAPFDELTVTGLLTAVLRDPVEPPRLMRRECPPELEAIVLRAMSRDREQRFASAAEMAQALADLATALGYPHGRAAWEAPIPFVPTTTTPQLRRSRPPAAPEPSSPEAAPPPVRRVRRPRRALLAIAAGAALAAGLLVWTAVGAIAGSGDTGGSELAAVERAPAPAESTGPNDTPSVAAAPPAVAAAPARPQELPPDVGLELLVAEPEPAPARAPTAGPQAPSRRSAIALALAATSPPPPAHHDSPSDRLADEALAAYVLGSLPRSHTLFHRAVAADRQNAAAWRGLGMVAYRLGDHEEASEALGHYLELRPAAPDAPRVRAMLLSMSPVPAPAAQPAEAQPEQRH